MLERGVQSFVFLWVLNPVMILFFQNCSWAPDARVLASAHAANANQAAHLQQMSSADRAKHVIESPAERRPACADVPGAADCQH